MSSPSSIKDMTILRFLPQQQPELCRGGDILAVLEDVDLQLTGDRLFGWLKMV